MPHRLISVIGLLALSLPLGAAARKTVDERLEQAVAEVSYFSFARAYKLFKIVSDDSNASPARRQQALYGMAVCAQQISPPNKSRIDEAIGLYELLLGEGPDSKFAPRATMNLGRIAELSDYYQDKVDLEAARRWYQKVIDRWPDKPIAGEAALRIAGTHIQTYDEPRVRKGVKLLESWLAKHPKDPLASGMWQYLADTCFFPLKDYARSLECYQKADRIGLLETGRKGIVYWRMAVVADRFCKNRELAVTYYTKIVTITPTSGKAYEAQSALKRLGAPVPEIKLSAGSEPLDRSPRARTHGGGNDE